MNISFDTITQFANFGYLIFLLTTVIFYYFFQRSFYVLLFSSIIFYASFSFQYCFLFLLICLINYLFGILIEKYRKTSIFVFAIVCNILVLIYFRYTGFFLENIGFLIPANSSRLFIDIVVPLGISFFLFEFLHYLIDVYRGSLAIKNFGKFVLFPFFFPSQIAGPIKRYELFLPQISQTKRIDWNLVEDGIFLLVKGFFKKIVIADNLLLLVEPGFTGNADTLTTLVSVYAFTFQIFFDFSGYTDIGRGSAALFGIKIPINFNQPYLATNIQEFWRRWHMTLMSWFRDYLYIPLGGSRKGNVRQFINTMIVFSVSGLWHGAAWHFVLWGVYNGILVSIARLFSFKNKYYTFRFIRLVFLIFTFQLVSFGWILFRAKDLATIYGMITQIVTFQFGQFVFTPHIIFMILLLLLYLCNGIVSQSIVRYKNISWMYRIFSYGVAIIFIVLNMDLVVNQFIYFQF